jgi:hypothetical protein
MCAAGHWLFDRQTTSRKRGRSVVQVVAMLQ